MQEPSECRIITLSYLKFQLIFKTICLMTPKKIVLAIIISGLTWSMGKSQNSSYPDPIINPESPLMLAGDWAPENTHDIDFSKLPKIPSEHAIIDDVRYAWGRKTQQHNYLVQYDGYFWAMWSDGPGVPRSKDP